MGFHRVQAQVEAVGDVLVAVALRQKLIDLALAVGEGFEAVGNVTGILQPGHAILEDARHGGAEERHAPLHGVNGLNQLFAGRILQDIAAGAGFHGAQDVAFVVVHAQDEHGGVRRVLENLGGGLDAVQLLHAHIDDGDIGFQQASRFHGFDAGTGFVHDVEIGVTFQNAGAGPGA